MPILILLVLAILIAQIGFWDTFQAILGGLAMVILLIFLGGGLVALAAYSVIRRIRGH
ncbi:MAG TPA: hypothetical protein VHM01_22140 [Alphaproteobacteria bacterium]|nr:hypothetical protein [Alphaproteobacteria bacterium]